MLADVQGVSQLPASAHPWALPEKHRASLWECVIDVWEQHFAVSERSTGQRSVGVLLHDLESVECPAPTASVPLRQVQLRVQQELPAA